MLPVGLGLTVLLAWEYPRRVLTVRFLGVALLTNGVILALSCFMAPRMHRFILRLLGVRGNGSGAD